VLTIKRKLMTEKTQANFYIPLEVKEMLEAMASRDLRSLSAQVEWLIREEHMRRQQPRQLVDTRASYAPEEA
jgi:hypothetical protein